VEHHVRRRRDRPSSPAEQALVSGFDWRRPGVRWGVGGAQVALLVGLVVIGLGPLLWLAKSAITPTQDTITHPMALFPNGSDWGNVRAAWTDVEVSRYFWNTVVLAFGSWLSQIIVATTAGFDPRTARF
jgi:multiple sugar transport system permease protein